MCDYLPTQRGLYNGLNPRHRRIIRLAALGHTVTEVCREVGICRKTWERVRHCRAGQAAFKAMLDRVDDEQVKLHSAQVILKSM